MRINIAKSCSKCHLIKPLTAFYCSHGKPAPRCMQCISAARKTENLIPCSECGRLYAASHRGREGFTGLCRSCYLKVWRCECGDLVAPNRRDVHVCRPRKQRLCSRCGEDRGDKFKETSSSRCRHCDVIVNQEQREILRAKARSLFGNKCARSGYCRCLAALDFHHLVPEDKKKRPSIKSKTMSHRHVLNNPHLYELICANCHREEHHAEGRRLPGPRPGRPKKLV